MAKRVGETEYGGEGGIIQSHPDHAAALDALVDRKAVKERFMIEKRAGRNDVSTVTETLNPDTHMIDITVEPYTIEQARAELEEKH